MQATAWFTALRYGFIACYAVSGVIERCYKRAREFSLNISYRGLSKSMGPRSICASNEEEVQQTADTAQRAALSTVLFTKLCKAEQSKRIRLPGRVESVGDKRNAHRIRLQT